MVFSPSQQAVTVQDSKFYESGQTFIPNHLDKAIRESIRAPGLDWYVHAVCHQKFQAFYWMFHKYQFSPYAPTPEREYMGIPNSTASRHCIQLIRQYDTKLTAYAAEMAGVKSETIGDFAHFIPWITARCAWNYCIGITLIMQELSSSRLSMTPNYGTCPM